MKATVSILLAAAALAPTIGHSAPPKREFFDVQECRQAHQQLEIAAERAHGRITRVSGSKGATWSPEYSEWRRLLDEKARVGSVCLAMTADGNTAAAAQAKINDAHEQASSIVLKSTRNPVVRATQKEALSGVRDQMAASATRLDEALWTLSDADFGGRPKAAEPADLWRPPAVPAYSPALSPSPSAGSTRQALASGRDVEDEDVEADEVDQAPARRSKTFAEMMEEERRRLAPALAAKRAREAAAEAAAATSPDRRPVIVDRSGYPDDARRCVGCGR